MNCEEVGIHHTNSVSSTNVVNTEKGMTRTLFSDIIKDVIGGTPGEVLLKVLLSSVALIWSSLSAMGLVTLGLFVITVFDSILGSVIARRKRIAFKTTRFLSGIAIKMFLFASILLCGSITDAVMIRSGGYKDIHVLFWMSTFLLAGAVISASHKYSRLANSKLGDYIEEKVGAFFTIKPKQKDDDTTV